jgi:hypothetical protein
MTCPGAPGGISAIPRDQMGVTELALLSVHERDCADCRNARESARTAATAQPADTPSRAFLSALGRIRDAARAGGAIEITARLTRTAASLSLSLYSAGRACATVGDASGRRATRLVGVLARAAERSARPLAQVPEATAAATARLAQQAAWLHAASTSRIREIAHATIAGAPDHAGRLRIVGRMASACVVERLTHARESFLSTTGRAWSVGRQWARRYPTARVRPLLGAGVGVAAIGILVTGAMFVWPRQWPDRSISRAPSSSLAPEGIPAPPAREPIELVSTRRPPAEAETVAAVAAPPPRPRAVTPPANQRVTTQHPPSPRPAPDIATSVRAADPAVTQERPAPDAPDPSAAIDWLLRGAGGTSRRDTERP